MLNVEPCTGPPTATWNFGLEAMAAQWAAVVFWNDEGVLKYYHQVSRDYQERQLHPLLMSVMNVYIVFGSMT